MRLVSTAFLATTILVSSTTLASADVKVIASIKPVHSLVAAVMEGIGKPELLVEGAGSPHTYSLKPSQAKKLQEADLVFWMSHDLEAFLEKSIEGIAKNAKSVPGKSWVTTLDFRNGAFEAHGDHDDHDVTMIMTTIKRMTTGTMIMTTIKRMTTGTMIMTTMEKG